MATSPSPNPRPGGSSQSSAVTGALGGVVVAPRGGGSSDPYNLGDLKSTMVVPGGLFPVTVDGKGAASADKVMEAFLHAPPGVVAAIQQKLYLSGAYSSNYNPMLHPGLIRPEDVAAFSSTLKVVAQQSTGDGGPMDLGSYLNSSAEFGAANGKAAASINYQTGTNVVTHQDPNYLNITADSVAQQILGRKATPAEAARFAAFFDKTDVGRQMKQYNAQDSAQAAYAQRQLDAAGGDTATPDATMNASPVPSTPPPAALASRDNTRASRMSRTNADLNGTAPASEPQSAPPDASVDKFMQAVAAGESGGNYDAVNSDTGAAGKFQIMPGNWPSWSREAGLGPSAARTPQNQDRVARYKMQQYYTQLGSWDAVAVAWYAGPGAAKEWLRNPDASRFTHAQRSGGNTYPSINDYVRGVSARLGSTGVLAPNPAPVGYGVDQPNIPISQRVDVTDTNPAADAQAFFRGEHPLEAAGKDVATTFDAFTQILQGR